MNPHDPTNGYEGDLTLVTLDLGVQVPVRCSVEEFDGIMELDDTYILLDSANGEPIRFRKSNVALWAPAIVQRQSGLAIPQNSIDLPPGALPGLR